MESWEAIAISQALRLGQFWHACNMPLTAHRYVNVKPLKIGINWRKFVPFHPLDLQKTDFFCCHFALLLESMKSRRLIASPRLWARNGYLPTGWSGRLAWHRLLICQSECLAKKARMSLAISSFFSARAKWPASSRWISAFGTSRLKASAPGAMNEGSFRPQITKVGGLCSRNHACHAGYEATFVR